MDWDDLRVFLAVTRDESLSRAARRLTMNPSTVGRRIARLETGLGRVLFAKTPQGYALTPEGARLVPAAEAAERAAAQADEALAASRRADRAVADRRARMAAPTTCCRRSPRDFATTIRGWRCRSSPCRASST